MAMSMRGSAGDDPMMGINTTPLIDVMLVLLIMFMMTIPIQTHAVKVDAPSGGVTDIDPVKNEIVITTDGTVRWNDRPVDLSMLRYHLQQSQSLWPPPELRIRPAHDARYERVDEVMAVIKREKVAKVGFVGNERYSGSF